MTLSRDHATRLKRALRGQSRAQMKAFLAVLRAADDRALLAVVAPGKKRAPKKGDPLLRQLEQTLRPILAPASEKADMLVEHMAKKHRRKLAIEPKGLADAARQLRAKFSDDQIQAGATSLVTRLTKLYGDRESVV